LENVLPDDEEDRTGTSRLLQKKTRGPASVKQLGKLLVCGLTKMLIWGRVCAAAGHARCLKWQIFARFSSRYGSCQTTTLGNIVAADVSPRNLARRLQIDALKSGNARAIFYFDSGISILAASAPFAHDFLERHSLNCGGTRSGARLSRPSSWCEESFWSTSMAARSVAQR
jgi:hypothetical protein